MDENDELTPEQAEAAFLAGLNDTPDPQIKEEDRESLEAIAEKTKEEEPTPEAPAQSFAGFTEAEIKSLFAKVGEFDSIKDQLAKAHGKIGELNRTIQESAKSAQQQPTSGFNPSPAEDEDDLGAAYPELAELAERRAKKVVADALAAKGDAPDVQAIVSQATAEIRREMELRLMDVMTPGWKDVVSSDDFKAWEAVQPDPVRQMFASTESAAELSAIVTGFKEWSARSKGQLNRNKNRLEAAVLPDGVPSKSTPAISDEDAFRLGLFGKL